MNINSLVSQASLILTPVVLGLVREILQSLLIWEMFWFELYCACWIDLIQWWVTEKWRNQSKVTPNMTMCGLNPVLLFFFTERMVDYLDIWYNFREDSTYSFRRMFLTNSGNLKLFFFNNMSNLQIGQKFLIELYLCYLSPFLLPSLPLSENKQTHIDIYSYKYTLCEYTKYNFSYNIFT